MVLAINKVDLMPASAVEQRTTAYRELFPNAADWTVISALEEAGRADLLERIVRLLPYGPRYFPEDQVTDQQERFIAAEMIREQVLLLTYQEVPHSVAVLVDEFKERPDGLTYVSATIYVERDTQKRILLGQGGHMIKQIGQGARVEIEEMVGSKVYLDLWVKVWEQWRKKDSRLRYLGYACPPNGGAALAHRQQARPPARRPRCARVHAPVTSRIDQVYQSTPVPAQGTPPCVTPSRRGLSLWPAGCRVQPAGCAAAGHPGRGRRRRAAAGAPRPCWSRWPLWAWGWACRWPWPPGAPGSGGPVPPCACRLPGGWA